MGTTGDTPTKRRVLLSALSLLWAILVPGAINSDTRLQFSSGYVAAVGVVVDEQGHPMLAEYDSNGKFVSDVGYLGIGELEKVVLYPAASWRAFQQFQQTIESENPEFAHGARLISAEEYEGLNFKTRNGDPIRQEFKPDLLPSTRSVFVISEDQMLNPEPTREGFILAEYPIALHEDPALEETDVTLILNEQGIVVRKSKFDISFKAAVYKEDAGPNEKDGTRLLWKPLSAVLVSTGPHDMPVYPGGIGTSREDGRYSMTYALPPCPGFAIEHRVPVVATINIENFNPKAEDLGFITSMQYDYKWCVGYGDVPLGVTPSAINAQLNARAIVATLATPIYDLNIIFSSLRLNAIGTLTNQVVDDFARLDDQTLELGPVEFHAEGSTVYAEDASPERIDKGEDYRFDFNLDGVDDIAVPNKDDASLIDVYISPNKPKDDAGKEQPPDFTRRKDYFLESQLSHQGLLTEINQADLEDTDIYIYRRSTNQLLGAIEGLVEQQKIDGPVQTQGNDKGRLTYRGVHTDEDFATFGFTSFIIGAASGDTFSNLRSRATSADPARRRPWQTSEDKASDFGKNNPPDALRPGETVQVIAINRVSGYIGTQEITVQPTGTALEPPEPIKMGPPNLKVIAKREFKDFDELTGEEKDRINIIGSEGAGLTSDTYVTIQTVWLDHNGDALPEALPGYTGRLAVSTSSSKTDDFSGNFEIKPGYQTQVVQLNNKSDPAREHFYVQVVGEHFDGNPNFESPGAGEGKLQTRPKNYVPILVPLFDEVKTRQSQEALTKGKLQGLNNLPKEVEPTYRWVYRPEMQFSTFELQKSRLRYLDTFGKLQVIDLTKPDINPIQELLNNTPEFVFLFYDLAEPQSNRLDIFGRATELVFSIGAEEESATITVGGAISFDEITHLDSLAYEELFSIRLYTNNDSANVLWQWAFMRFDINIDSDSNNGFDHPEENAVEDRQEFEINQPEIPGKILFTQIRDSDFDSFDENDDQRPDFADYIIDDSDSHQSRFTPVVLRLAEYETPNEKIRLLFEYNASDPNMIERYGDKEITGYQYIPAPGALRIWVKKASESRDPKSVIEGGDWVPPNLGILLEDLPEIKDSGLVLYIETVGLSQQAGDHYIKVSQLNED